MPPETPYRILEGGEEKGVPANYKDLLKVRVFSEDKLEESIISEREIAGQFGTGQIADNAITTAKIAANAVTCAKLGTASVPLDRIKTTLLVDTDVTFASPVAGTAQYFAVQVRGGGANGTAFALQPLIIALSPKTNPGAGAPSINFDLNQSAQLLANDNADVENQTRTQITIKPDASGAGFTYVLRLKVWRIEATC